MLVPFSSAAVGNSYSALDIGPQFSGDDGFMLTGVGPSVVVNVGGVDLIPKDLVNC